MSMNPFAFWAPAVQLSFVMWEAQSVIAMRCLGMAGVWSVTPEENQRMVSEKLHALTRASTDAARVALRGGSPDQILSAGVKPLRQKTRANMRRLSKRGLRH